MRNASRVTRAVVTTLVLLIALPSPSAAWGSAAHKLLMARAIDALPVELKPFFTARRDELLLRVNDPDVWRTAGWPDDANHFLNFGVAAYGAYPFGALPREYGAAVGKFGADAVQSNGLLPWRVDEEFGNLRRAFAAFRGSSYGAADIVLFAAVSAHYIQDACQPLHATVDYDGKQGSAGIHARFERDLIARYQSRINITTPPKIDGITNARDAAFDVLLASHQLVPALFAADAAAADGTRVYGDAYYDRLFAGVKAMLEERLSSAATATAALIVGAWQQAGRPPMPSMR
jgi:hypothetical protein